MVSAQNVYITKVVEKLRLNAPCILILIWEREIAGDAIKTKDLEKKERKHDINREFILYIFINI